MKKLFLLFGLCAALNAAEVLTTVTANTGLTLLTGKKHVLTVTLFNETTNNATIKFYDSIGNSTNIVVGAYTNVSQAPASYTNTYTTPEGATITNVFNGVTTTYTAVPAATNQRTAAFNFSARKSSTTQKLFARQFVQGVTIFSTETMDVLVEYEDQP